MIRNKWLLFGIVLTFTFGGPLGVYLGYRHWVRDIARHENMAMYGYAIERLCDDLERSYPESLEDLIEQYNQLENRLHSLPRYREFPLPSYRPPPANGQDFQFVVFVEGDERPWFDFGTYVVLCSEDGRERSVKRIRQRDLKVLIRNDSAVRNMPTADSFSGSPSDRTLLKLVRQRIDIHIRWDAEKLRALLRTSAGFTMRECTEPEAACIAIEGVGNLHWPFVSVIVEETVVKINGTDIESREESCRPVTIRKDGTVKVDVALGH